jgi:hypothetical protein
MTEWGAFPAPSSPSPTHLRHPHQPPLYNPFMNNHRQI